MQRSHQDVENLTLQSMTLIEEIILDMIRAHERTTTDPDEKSISKEHKTLNLNM